MWSSILYLDEYYVVNVELCIPYSRVLVQRSHDPTYNVVDAILKGENQYHVVVAAISYTVLEYCLLKQGLKVQLFIRR